MIVSSKKDLRKSVVKINDVELTMESSVKVLGIEIDNKLNFEKHVPNICKKSRQSTKCDLQSANVNYGCLIWYFSSKTSQNKVEKIHERSLKFPSNDYLSSYAEVLEKSTSVSMGTKRLRTMV